ncbi:hypothetical protein Ddye_021159 [Dipteronia dyeriana]|uniref:Uncharacterized protein n=1 Tax=Dipteronia dyeriana TaxID=168575 RepID=A0AAD9U262_9ROSI|nr:hypothetical protein Ddye_021159 [Dipteronia dyeriana]
MQLKNCKELPITGVIDYIIGILQFWSHDRHTAALKLTTQLTTATDVAIVVKDEEARYMRIYPIIFYTFHVKDGAYSGEIHPVGQPNEWLVLEDIASRIVHPPVGRRGLGRPKQIALRHLERK